MTEKELLKRAAQQLREDRAGWDALTRGVMRDGASAASAPVGLGPAGEGALERIVARIDAELASVRAARAGRAYRMARVASAQQRQPMAHVAWVIAPLMAAGAILLWLLGAVPSRALPAYELSSAPLLHREADLAMVLKPTALVAGEVEARAFVVRDGQVAPWSAPLDRDADGAWHVKGKVGAHLDGPDGVREIDFAIGRPGAVPLRGETINAAREHPEMARAAGWQLVRALTTVVP
jgi:hypothetical protein